MKLYKIFTALFITLLSTKTSTMTVPANTAFSSMPRGALYGLGLGFSLLAINKLVANQCKELNNAYEGAFQKYPFNASETVDFFIQTASFVFAPYLAALTVNELNSLVIEKGFSAPSEVINPLISGLTYAGSITAGIYGAYGVASCLLGIRDMLGIRKNRNMHDGVWRTAIGSAVVSIATPFVYHAITRQPVSVALTTTPLAGMLGLGLACR